VIIISVLTSLKDLDFEDVYYMVLTIFSIMAFGFSKPHSNFLLLSLVVSIATMKELKPVKHNYSTLYNLLLQHSTDGIPSLSYWWDWRVQRFRRAVPTVAQLLVGLPMPDRSKDMTQA